MPETTDTVNANMPVVVQQPNPMLMLQSLIERGADPAKLEKMMDLVERWEKNQAAQAFGAALAKFQELCPPIVKWRETKAKPGTEFAFKYASFDDVMAAARPHLATCGIACAFDSEHKEESGVASLKVTVRIRVGSYFEDRTFTCPVPKDLKASEPQRYGAALSYAKRYALCAALNIVGTDQDDDAQTQHDYLTEQQKAALVEFIRHVGMKVSDVSALCRWLEVADIDHILQANHVKAMEGVRDWATRNSPQSLKTYKPGNSNGGGK